MLAKKKSKISYIVRDDKENGHRLGINSMALSQKGVLLTASRDATVRCWNTNQPHCPLMMTLEGHTDWVNGVCVTNNEDIVVSCSSDTTIKVWNVDKGGQLLGSLTKHSDFVKAVAYAREGKVLASVGLDGQLLLWDVEVALKSNDRRSLDGNENGCVAATRRKRDSMYCVDINSNATRVVAGCSDKIVRLWDPRTAAKQMKLKGHNDNIRAVVISEDGTKCVTGSSDKTVKLWDLGQQRVIQSMAMHSDSVWALAANREFTKIFSGGRDHQVFRSCLDSYDSCLLIEDDDPCLSLIYSPVHNELWTSTTKSTVKKWTLDQHQQNDGERAADYDDDQLVAPTLEIKGFSELTRYHMLENRRHVLTQDSNNEISLWDITTGTKTRTFGKNGDFDKVAEELSLKVVIPSWCSLDVRLGRLCVNMTIPTCVSANLYAVDAGLEHAAESDEEKVNIGVRVLRGLFRNWLKAITAREASEEGAAGVGMLGKMDCDPPYPTMDSKLDYNIGGDTAVFITEGDHQVPVLFKTVAQFDGDEVLPYWLIDILRGRAQTATEKIGFSLVSIDASIPSMAPARLTAPPFLRMNKVLTFIGNKITLIVPEDLGSVDETKEAHQFLEILCNNKVVPLSVSLATARKFYSDNPTEDLVLQYRWKRS